MPEFRASFIERIERTPSVSSFRFRADAPVAFVPGQFAQLCFDEKDKANRSLNKYLSFSCAPGKDYLEFTKRLSGSDFSKCLLALKKDDRVWLKGPMGHVTLSEGTGKAGFLVGGIGITPVISMLEHLSAQRQDPDIVFLYANMNDNDIAFLDELKGFERTLARLRLVHIVVNRILGDEKVFTGLIDKQFVLKQIPDYKERTLYIFGPPAMVKAMETICNDLGCAPEKVKAENFVGY